MLYYGFAIVYVLSCAFLLIVVLLQQGKGGDIASAFGGSSSQQAFGARSGATVLTRATTVLGALFMVGALALNIVGGTSLGGSVVSGIKAPAATAPATPPLSIPAGTTAPVPPVAAPPATAPATTPVKKDGGVAPIKKDIPSPAPAGKGRGGV